MKETILITGATGFIGKHLTSLLLKKGYTIHLLSRKNAPAQQQVKIFKWDIYKREIDPDCIKGVDAIIHLAGEPVIDKAWTKKRKQEIIESRVESLRMIYDLLKTVDHRVKSVVSASGVGYYGDAGDELLTEQSKAGNDFLAQVCIDWEKVADEGKELGLRVVKLRTGIVLGKDGGALKPIALPVKFGFGAALGSGKQWTPWIHIDDAVAMYLFALENTEAEGVYNMSAPVAVTNKELTKAIALQLKRPLFLPNVPAFALKLVLGGRAASVLGSTKTSSEKIENAGFKFKFETLPPALKDIYS